MNRNDIIRMAREAGYGEAMSDLHAPALERFAALVAAHEREMCAKICDLHAREIDNTNNIASWLAEVIRTRGEQWQNKPLLILKETK